MSSSSFNIGEEYKFRDNNDIIDFKKLVSCTNMSQKHKLLDILCNNRYNNHYYFIKYLLDNGVNPNYNCNNWFNYLYKLILNHKFKCVKLLIVYGININDIDRFIHFFNTKHTNIFKYIIDWIKLVKDCSRFRIACSFMTKDEIIDLSKRNVIQLDFDKEIKQLLINTSHNMEIKKLIKSYYKGWKPNINYIFSKQSKSIVFVIMNIYNHICNNNNNNTFYLKQYTLPQEIWYIILNYAI